LSRATSPNNGDYEKKPIKEREKELRQEVDIKHQQDPYDFTKKDIIAMIIAAYKAIMPIVLIGVIVMIVFTFLFLKIYN